MDRAHKILSKCSNFPNKICGNLSDLQTKVTIYFLTISQFVLSILLGSTLITYDADFFTIEIRSIIVIIALGVILCIMGCLIELCVPDTVIQTKPFYYYLIGNAVAEAIFALSIFGLIIYCGITKNVLQFPCHRSLRKYYPLNIKVTKTLDNYPKGIVMALMIGTVIYFRSIFHLTLELFVISTIFIFVFLIANYLFLICPVPLDYSNISIGYFFCVIPSILITVLLCLLACFAVFILFIKHLKSRQKGLYNDIALYFIQNDMDYTQQTLQCCGLSGPQEYNNRTPSSCCEDRIVPCTPYKSSCVDAWYVANEHFLVYFIVVILILTICQIITIWTMFERRKRIIRQQEQNQNRQPEPPV